MRSIFRPAGRMYLDYASVTPVDPRVMKAMSKTLRLFPANPSSLYMEGVQAGRRLEEARRRIAGVLDAHAEEIILTSGGTESNNLAIRGVIEAWKARQKVHAVTNVDADGDAKTNGVRRNLASGTKHDEKTVMFRDSNMLAVSSSLTSQTEQRHSVPHIISTVIEHPSVRELLLRLEKSGACEVTLIPVGADGIISAQDVKKALRPNTVLVSVMMVNNEVGTIQPVSQVAKIIRAFKKEQAREAVAKPAESARLTETDSGVAQRFSEYPYLHTDACQAAQHCPLRVPPLGVDLMTLDGSKVYGPRSTGMLYARRGVKMFGEMTGGDQEHGLRAGTESVAAADGLALALELCQAERESEGRRQGLMRDKMLADIQRAIPAVTVNGSMHERVPNNINICLKGMDAEFAVLKLDARGVCVSSVTSCRSRKEDSSSYVIEAMDKARVAESHDGAGSGHEPSGCSKSSLRITLGRFTTERQAQAATAKVISVLTGML